MRAKDELAKSHKSTIFHHHGRHREKEYFNASNIMQISPERLFLSLSHSILIPRAFFQRETQELAHFLKWRLPFLSPCLPPSNLCIFFNPMPLNLSLWDYS